MNKFIKHPTDDLTYKIIGLAMEVHGRLGPGLKEQMYQKADVGLLINFGRKFLEYKRIFPPKKITDLIEADLRFGVRFGSEEPRTIKTSQRTQYVR